MMFVSAGSIIALLSVMIGLDKLSVYEDDIFYQLTRVDLFNIIFALDDVETYPYISKDDISLFFLPVTFYFMSMSIGCSTFLLKKRNYYHFIYSRAGSKQSAFRWMKGDGIKRAAVFIISYHVTLYIVSHMTFLKGSEMPEQNLILYLVLHAINNICVIIFLQAGVFLVYCMKGVGEAVLVGAMLIIGMFIIDMMSDQFNILLFNRNNYFIDGIIISGVLYMIVNKISRAKAIQLPY